jgi:GT2 family glycosyltransferase
MARPALSVVIPTHKRGMLLGECLKRLERQTMKERMEVVVVSDGAMDKETQQLAKETFQIPVIFTEVPKSQQGAARNQGVRMANGEIVLFIGDDIVVDENACAAHLEAHRNAGKNPCAVLGFITWDKSLPITPVMRWLERTGWQFGFPSIARFAHRFVPRDIQHSYTYTSNISVPLDIARTLPFKEGLSLYGWEDVEWGLRLKREGIPLFYEPNAKAEHHHPMTLEDSLKRMETLGRSAVSFQKEEPDLRIVPYGWKLAAYHLLSYIPTLRGRHAKAFLAGIRRGKEQ